MSSRIVEATGEAETIQNFLELDEGLCCLSREEEEEARKTQNKLKGCQTEMEQFHTEWSIKHKTLHPPAPKAAAKGRGRGRGGGRGGPQLVEYGPLPPDAGGPCTSCKAASAKAHARWVRAKVCSVVCVADPKGDARSPAASVPSTVSPSCARCQLSCNCKR